MSGERSVAIVETILTLREMSDYLRLHPNTVWQYVTAGKITGFKIGRRWRFNKNQIDNLLKIDQVQSSH